MRDKIEKVIHTLRFTRKQQQYFLEDLASLLNDGVSLSDAITTIETIAEGIVKIVASSVNHSLSAGESIAHGITDWFPTEIVEIIRAGENSGTLNQAAQSAVHALKQHANIVSSMISYLTYPCIVLILALIMLVIIKQSVLTNFASIKTIDQWPSQGVSLYHMGEFVEYWWWAILSVIVLGIIVTYKFLSNFTGNLRNHIDKVPLFSLYRDSISARFMQTLGLLLSNGIIIKKALNIMAYDAQPYLAWHIILMEYRLSGGIDNIAEVLDTQLIRDSDLIRLKIVAKGKGFAPALISLGQQTATKNQSTSLMLARIAGALVLVLAASIAGNIIFGIYSIGSILAH